MRCEMNASIRGLLISSALLLTLSNGFVPKERHCLRALDARAPPPSSLTPGSGRKRDTTGLPHRHRRTTSIEQRRFQASAPRALLQPTTGRRQSSSDHAGDTCCPAEDNHIASTTVGSDVRTNLENRRRKCDANGASINHAQQRRRLLLGGLFLSASVTTLGEGNAARAAVERAVGSAELSCRERGDCLEKGDWDGAVGWTWGGRDRCDATDPRCGPDGKLRDAPLRGDPVPSTDGKTITHQVEIDVTIGRNEGGTLRLGLYGEDCPVLTGQLLDLCDAGAGFVTGSRLMLQEGYGVISAPVKLASGGLLNLVYPGERLEFGVPSQAASYARAKGRAKAGDDFSPQPRPPSGDAEAESSARKHDAAGLLSVPGKGLGYGGTGFESDDEAFASAFQLTAFSNKSGASSSAMDREGRKVIGQCIDDASMDLLARLSSIPTRKGLKGVIPGQSVGPPLLKVVVTRTAVSTLEKSAN